MRDTVFTGIQKADDVGGQVFVGIRRSDGSEHLSEVWTNIMPEFFSDPAFFEEGPSVAEFIAEAKPENEWPKSKPQTGINPSEYGVILVDFKLKTIFSRQDYCTPGGHLTFGSGHQPQSEFSKVVKALDDRGLLDGVYTDYADYGWRKNALDEAGMALFRERVQAGLSKTDFDGEVDKFHYVMRHKVGDLKVDRGDGPSARAQHCWPEVLEFHRRAEWKSPIWNLEQVKATIEDDE